MNNCVSDTIENTVRKLSDGSLFMITGDIPAMWLRDSSCQLHFLIPYANEEPEIKEIIKGINAKQIECILLDPYANAFNAESDGKCYSLDKTDMKPELWERKYEIDSLCYPFQLSYLYYKATGDTSVFTDNWRKAAVLMIETFETEMFHETKSTYTFERENCPFTDTLSRGGKGALVNSGIGLIWSGFRPSDDACVYGYLIPSNMFAVVALEYVAEIAKEIYADDALSARAQQFSEDLRRAIAQYAIVPNRKTPYYAYEVDGYGQYLIMDDANVPSLLAMPYFGFCKPNDELYQNTRKVILSQSNPYYYSGSRMQGIGSPHTVVNRVWPIALAIQGLTTDDMDEKKRLIDMIADNDDGTLLVHESVDVDDSSVYSRPWFSWANMMFCELLRDYCERCNK